MNTSRRQFLQLFSAAVAAAAVLPKSTLWMPDEEEPRVRRYWQVGDVRHSGYFPAVQKPGGMVPMPGEPGLFMDAATGQVLNIRDFKESDKWDTIVIQAGNVRPNTAFSFFADIQAKNQVLAY